MRTINENMRFVPEQEQGVVAAKLDSLAECIKETARPYKEFTLTNKSAGKKLTKQWKRKETERAYSAKFPGRNKGRKTQVQQKKSFPKVQPSQGKSARRPGVLAKQIVQRSVGISANQGKRTGMRISEVSTALV